MHGLNSMMFYEYLHDGGIRYGEKINKKHRAQGETHDHQYVSC